MPINEKLVKWDDSPNIDHAAIQWDEPSLLDKNIDVAKNIGLGGLSALTGVGKTLSIPVNKALDYVAPLKNGLPHSIDMSNKLDNLLNSFGGDNNSTAFKGGKLAGDVLATLPVGGALARGAEAIPTLAKYAPLLQSGGFNLGAANTGNFAANAALRAGAGAVNGGISAGLIDPSSAGTGAAIGGAIPVAGAAAGNLAQTAGRAISGQVSDAAATLADKAKQLGIDIPLDRLTNSKPLNAIAASLNYIPFSGRTTTEQNMEAGLNKALSNTFGFDTPNVSMALRAAPKALGSKFDDFLTNNNAVIDDSAMQKISDTLAKARNELSDSDYKIIENQALDLIGKADGNGVVQGQAAYNVKKNLDRIGNRNSNEAYYATQLKNNLMDAYKNAVSPDTWSSFQNLRKQYGNMKDLENLAQNGAEGNISVARLAGLKDIGNQDVQNLADIAAQFVKSREGQHGAAQRVAMGAIPAAGWFGGGATGAIAALPLAVGIGRGVNGLLNSQTLKNAALGSSPDLPNFLKQYGLLNLPSTLSAQ